MFDAALHNVLPLMPVWAADAGTKVPEIWRSLWLIPGLPLLAAALTALLGPQILKKHSHWPCIVAVIGSFIVSAIAFLNLYLGTAAPLYTADWAWITAGNVDIPLKLRFDALAGTMAVMVTFISSCIAIYSVGYMHDDPGYSRFFAAVALFVTSMTLLVLGDNFILLFAGWEGVGLCSYLLIGFWFYKDSAADAARKAFLVTRLGDVGLFLGILLLWWGCQSLDYDKVFKAVEKGTLSETMLFAASLLLFCGAAGKSAQLPLHVWLPDAMEGPTPVSALIHAATMVTAGVYLLARCVPIFLGAPDAQLLVACIGGGTALFAALIALTQTDLKRVLAYSTLSQLGYMFLALGCGVYAVNLNAGSKDLALLAVTAAMFHLFTHAFFKALLFMGSGSVMHAMGHVIDMRRFSGLRHVMPTTHWTFLVGAIALAGIPPLAGFWSKDEILLAAYTASSQTDGTVSSIYFTLLCLALLTAFLTAFYTFRAYFLTFCGEVRIPEEADAHHGHGHGDSSHHGHGGDHHKHDHHAPSAHSGPPKRQSYESPAVMTIPLIVLAVFALGVGWLLGPLGIKAFSFAGFVEHTPYWPHPEHHEHSLNWMLMGLSTVLAGAGIGLAYLMYSLQPALPGQLAKSMQALYQLSLNKFFVDELYEALIVRPASWLAKGIRSVDMGLVDSFVDMLGMAPRLIGQIFQPIQNGLVQFYALAMALGLTVFLLSLIYKM